MSTDKNANFLRSKTSTKNQTCDLYIEDANYYQLTPIVRKTFQRDDDTHESKGLVGIVGWTKFQHHLLFRSQVKFLQVAMLIQVPDVHFVSYSPASSNSGLRPSFTIFGVPHSEVIMVSRPRCHQKS